MNADVDRVAANCCRLILADEPWRSIGFAGCPRRGAAFRILRPKWKIALEDKVLREMLSMFAAAHIVAEAGSDEFRDRLVRTFMATPDLSTAFGFACQADGTSYLQQTIEQYVTTSTGEWHKLLVDHLQPLTLPEGRTRARLLVGCVQLPMSLQTMMIFVRDDAAKRRASPP